MKLIAVGLAASVVVLSAAFLVLLRSFLDSTDQLQKLATQRASHRCSPSPLVEDWRTPVFEVHDYLESSVDPALVDRKPASGEWPFGVVSGRG